MEHTQADSSRPQTTPTPTPHPHIQDGQDHSGTEPAALAVLLLPAMSFQLPCSLRNFSPSYGKSDPDVILALLCLSYASQDTDRTGGPLSATGLSENAKKKACFRVTDYSNSPIQVKSSKKYSCPCDWGFVLY